MTRSISRPFGRPAMQPTGQGEQTPYMPSVTEFVLQDTSADTPHDIHPHAAAWASSQLPPQPNPMDQAPMRIATGHVHEAKGRPKPATAEERAAYIQMRNLQLSARAAAADNAPGTRTSAPADTYAQTAKNVDPSFRVAPTATYSASAPTQPLPQTPANASRARTPSPTPSVESDNETPLAGQNKQALSPVRSQLGSPVVLNPPRRTSSLAASLRQVPPIATGPTEMEITYRAANGRAVTIKLYGP